MTVPLSPVIPAATVVIFRERADAAPDLLMVERSAALAFAPGALVFPGGRVDAGDREMAATIPGGSHVERAGRSGRSIVAGAADDVSSRIAAVRETIEEVGLSIGADVPAGRLPALRADLHAGRTLAQALATADGRLALDRLHPFARWRPAHLPRNFDTRFYLARLTPGAPSPAVDGTENVRLLWATAAELLEQIAHGEAKAVFPTRRMLERLAQFATFEAAVLDARTRPDRIVTPWFERRSGVLHGCIPDDLGYPVTAEPLADPERD